jgi:small subunit ribosomal protein S16
MAVKVRLARGGTTNAPFYHIVAADSRSPRDGKFLEKIGFYNPKVSKEKETELNKRINIDLERAKYWISVGAQVSETVAKFFVNAGISEASKFIKPIVKGEFFGIARKEKKKILSDRADAAKKLAAERKKAKEQAAKEKANA